MTAHRAEAYPHATPPRAAGIRLDHRQGGGADPAPLLGRAQRHPPTDRAAVLYEGLIFVIDARRPITPPAISCPPSPPKAKRRGLTLSAEETPPGATPDGVRAPARGGAPASRLCPVCRKVPIHARQEVCSGRCRAARSRQRKAAARRERDAEIRSLLEMALEKLQEGVP